MSENEHGQAYSAARAPTPETPLSPQARKEFIERFAAAWSSRGISRIEGLIAAYLLTDETGRVTSQELAENLGVSRGSVSTYTRQLIAGGFITMRKRAGDRTHYFTMPDDVWGNFLAKEQEYLLSQRDLATSTLPHAAAGSKAHARLNNMARYMDWISSLHLADLWQEHRAKTRPSEGRAD